MAAFRLAQCRGCGARSARRNHSSPPATTRRPTQPGGEHQPQPSRHQCQPPAPKLESHVRARSTLARPHPQRQNWRPHQSTACQVGSIARNPKRLPLPRVRHPLAPPDLRDVVMRQIGRSCSNASVECWIVVRPRVRPALATLDRRSEPSSPASTPATPTSRWPGMARARLWRVLSTRLGRASPSRGRAAG